MAVAAMTGLHTPRNRHLTWTGTVMMPASAISRSLSRYSTGLRSFGAGTSAVMSSPGGFQRLIW